MNKYLVILLLLISCNNNAAQNTSKLDLVKKAFLDKNEKAYLENFPDSFNSFKTTFGWDDKADKPYPLYNDANQYIDYYFDLVTKKYPSYKKKVIDIAIGGIWQADGVNYFLTHLHKLVETDRSIEPLLDNLNDDQLNFFWRFYFSKQNLAYPPQLSSVLSKRMQIKSLSVFKTLQKVNGPDNRTSFYEVYDKDGFTNLRKGNNATSPVIGRVNTGDHITVLNATTDWWYVDTKEGTGYIHKSRIRLGDNNVKNQRLALCTYNEASAKLNFVISVVKYKEGGKKPDELNIAISDNVKSSPFVNISFKPEYWINNVCTATSYVGKLATNEGVEKYNKFIIADYNFDGLEDFAILTYEGGNGGPRYSYFLQDKKQSFIKSSSFPLQDSFFPKKIDGQNRTLTITGPVGCCKINTTIYQLKSNDQWATILTKEDKK